MPFVKRASAGTLGTGGRAVTISSTDRSDLRARSGADGVGGTASADFGSSRSLPLITAGTLGAGGVTTEGSNVSRSDFRTSGGAAGIGGVIAVDLGAGGWLFKAGLVPALARAGRGLSRFPPSSMMRLFPTELRLTTSLLAAAARSLFCVDLGSDLSSTITRAPAPAVSLLTAMTGPRLTTKRWPGPASLHPGKSNTRRSGCWSRLTSGCTSSLNATSTSTPSTPSATDTLVIAGRELLDARPAASWEAARGAAKTTARRSNDAAASIRMAGGGFRTFRCALPERSAFAILAMIHSSVACHGRCNQARITSSIQK